MNPWLKVFGMIAFPSSYIVPEPLFGFSSNAYTGSEGQGVFVTVDIINGVAVSSVISVQCFKSVIPGGGTNTASTSKLFYLCNSVYMQPCKYKPTNPPLFYCYK